MANASLTSARWAIGRDGGRRGRGKRGRRETRARARAREFVALGEETRDNASTVIRRACAALRTRCFYEYDAEEGLIFDFGSSAGDVDACVARAREQWWSGRVTSECTRARRFEMARMFGVHTFAAIEGAGDCARWDASTGEHPADAAALRSWTVLPARSNDAADAIVVGTLDVHFGRSLPGEFLIGTRPSLGDDSDADAESRFDPVAALNPPRAYVFNVCVSPENRGRGIAEFMLNATADWLAAHTDARAAYVHVERDNVPARRAYEKAGFAAESAETDAEALARERPPRLLLHREITRR
ncbi:Acyl-CoA N-acyltransferase [Ostreococcus tauri]|uniref:Acyl-CoA N-acyltransferase n=2 Tax=Ostreococcus tauri TaxID=70448 RepID=A0A090LZA5_OSTTA|nr:Acyl-CoA N-acyltransferase [Ostreococcus tauri]OUS44096.1 hypothetical protein BE221DRAFT_194271 [Ostreococcus tauri]CEF97330.1 Acyl-CoA N-acyltransferase [Ostreococcus tauri]|eukprot:XP_022838634.1 Acyl-CoA N-acyltransferase [Ostreococcus tauri]